MTTQQLVPLVLSFLALMVSIYGPLRNWWYTEISVGYAARNNYSNALLEIDKQLIARPELWAIYDTHYMSATRSEAPAERARREAFILFHFNLFETVFDDYKLRLKFRSMDRQYWSSWRDYVTDFFRASSEARLLFRRIETKRLFLPAFQEFICQVITEVEVKPVPPAPVSSNGCISRAGQ
jgi:hypothetical protein